MKKSFLNQKLARKMKIRASLKENSSLHIFIAKAGLQLLTDLFSHKISTYPAKIPNVLFCHCTNSLSSRHTSNHYYTFCASLHVKTSPDENTITFMQFELMKEFVIIQKPDSPGTEMSRELNVQYLSARYINGVIQLSCSAQVMCRITNSTSVVSLLPVLIN